MSSIPELEHLQESQARISGSLHRTPTVSSRTLSERVGRPVDLDRLPDLLGLTD